MNFTINFLKYKALYLNDYASRSEPSTWYELDIKLTILSIIVLFWGRNQEFEQEDLDSA